MAGVHLTLDSNCPTGVDNIAGVAGIAGNQYKTPKGIMYRERKCRNLEKAFMTILHETFTKNKNQKNDEKVV